MTKTKKIKKMAGKAARFARRNAPVLVPAALVAGGFASAADDGAFDIGAAGIAAKVTVTMLGIAAAGAGLKATGIGIKVAFKWAERLLKG